MATARRAVHSHTSRRRTDAVMDVQARPRTVDFETHLAVTTLIYDGIQLMDRKDFKGWLDMCDTQFDYQVTAWSPEIRKDMAWLRHDREGMEHLVKLLPRHNTDQSAFTRHTNVYTIKPSAAHDDGGAVDVVSAVTVYRTTLDGGETSIFAIGRYFDVVTLGDTPNLRSRTVRLDTRALGIGTHYPL